MKRLFIISMMLLIYFNLYSQVKVNLLNEGIYHGIVIKDKIDTLFLSDIRNYIKSPQTNTVIAIPKIKIWGIVPQKIELISENIKYSGKIVFADFNQFVLDTGSEFSVLLETKNITNLSYYPIFEEKLTFCLIGSVGYFSGFYSGLSIATLYSSSMLSLGADYNYNNKEIICNLSYNKMIWDLYDMSIFLGGTLEYIVKTYNIKKLYFDNEKHIDRRFFVGLQLLLKYKNIDFENGIMTNLYGFIPFTKISFAIDI